MTQQTFDMLADMRLSAMATECINRREFAICTEKTCHNIGDFPPPRRPPSTKKLCRQSHRQSSEILIFYFGYWNIVLL